MKIKFTDSVAGANFAYRRGQVIDLRIDLARGFIKARQAVEFVEEAVTGPVETAMLPRMARGVRRVRRALGA